MKLPNNIRIPLLKVREFTRLVLDTISDSYTYYKFAGSQESAFRGTDSPSSVSSQAMKDSHRIEKGLALPSPKQPFGSKVAERLEVALDSNVLDPQLANEVRSSLDGLETWNSKSIISDEVAPVFQRTVSSDRESFESVVLGRRSIRNFDPKVPVALVELEDAISIALHSPSVCNRRPWRVHIYQNQAKIAELLKHQNGNSGFSHTVSTLLVITTTSRSFFGAAERNQRWIDGGIFASTLVHSLQFKNIATCMLNWSRTNADSSRLKRAADISNEENIIVLVAAGYPSTGARVARSPLRPPADHIVLH